MYPAIAPKRMSGEEQIVAPNGVAVCSLNEFWQWAYSDLLGNAERGALAEYLVACALGVDKKERISWSKYDLITNEGISVEVKTSGYLQTWMQKQLSKPLFGIRSTYGWDPQTNAYDSEKKRQADIYVFCLHKHTDQETANPLLISQWEFYLLPSGKLDAYFGDQKSASLSALIKAGAELCRYEDLCRRIHEIV